MSNIAKTFFVGFFTVIALAIIFVQAGKQTNRSGGQQTADIAYGLGGGLSQLGSALETGNSF